MSTGSSTALASALPGDRQAWRVRLAGSVEAPRVQAALIACILLNAMILGLETAPWARTRFGEYLYAADRVMLGIFVVEIALRLIARGRAFLRDPWSVFDAAVVAIALVPDSGAFAVLRALRVVRVMRLISLVPSMRQVASGLLAAIPGLGAVIGIIAVILYVSAVMATKLFGEAFPHWFGTLGESAFTLFQLMTLEGWADSTRGARSWADLPGAAVKYVRRIEELIGAPVALLSTSPEREDTILMRDPFTA